jgi:hypothetical protein
MAGLSGGYGWIWAGMRFALPVPGEKDPEYSLALKRAQV